jgi:hypothetical protein
VLQVCALREQKFTCNRPWSQRRRTRRRRRNCVWIWRRRRREGHRCGNP